MASALLGSAVEEVETEPSHSSCPAYDELLEVMECAMARLDLPWKRAKMVAPRGRLDECYLSGHNPPARVSLPFLPDLHAEVEKASSKPLQKTSCLNGSAYAAVGQAVTSLNTMAVLQAYQADLLKDLDRGQDLSPDEVAELRRTPDLVLCATKQAATAMGRSMATMVVAERHLWLNLADIGKKEKGFLLDAPVSPSELFGTSIETVVKNIREDQGTLSGLQNLHSKKVQV